MAAIIVVLFRGVLTGRAAARAARAALGHRPRAGARRLADLADLADLVQLYGNREAYDEEQRRCGLHQLDVPSRVEHQLAW
jgi:hypothetical protein